ncbi:MAG: outer membrane beta-barrel protein [Bryobacteraceae bacterium]
MRSYFLLFALLGASSLAFAQGFEASVSGGVSHMQNNAIGADTFSPGATSGSQIRLTDGFRLALRMGFNPYSHLGFEVGYAYNRTKLHFDGPPVSETGFGIHQGFVDALFHFTPEKSRVRPFVAGGIQFSNFVPPGASAQYGQGENKFGVNYGAGLKVRVKENWQVRFDIRQFETGKPFSLPGASGRLLQDEISIGVGYVI